MALGLAGLILPERYGGTGLGLIDLAMAVEVLGYGVAAGPIIEHLVGAMAISAADDDDVKSQWLPDIARGTAIATLALGDSWLPEDWTPSIEDGSVSGTVRFVPGAASAHLFVLGTKGGGLALVRSGDGVSVEPLASSDRTRRLSTVSFAKAPATVLFDRTGPTVERIFDCALVLIAADALGGAQYCVDLAVSYAKEREQFGQPIGRFQALKHQLATMALETEPARALMWYAAYAQDAFLPDARRAAAIAKAHLADRFVSVARAAVMGHGGIGYTWEYGLVFWLRRSLFDRAYLGSPAVHRARAADMADW
jgi:alkylation response protein AidB-like acyl-CoA dehydrogenase